MRNALRSIVILGILIVLDAVVFVPMNATAQAKPNPNKGACCIPGNPPTWRQPTAATAHTVTPGATSPRGGPASATPRAAASTTTTTAAPTTTTSSAAPTTTTSTTIACLSLKYTTQAGTTSCGGVRLSP